MRFNLYLLIGHDDRVLSYIKAETARAALSIYVDQFHGCSDDVCSIARCFVLDTDFWK